MKLIQTVLTSRTTYVIIAMFVVGGLQAVTQLVPPAYLPVVEGILGLLGLYTHAISKSQLQNQVNTNNGI